MPKPHPTDPAGHRLRIGRQSVDFGGYSITKVVHDRRLLLANEGTAKVIVDSWAFLRDRDRIKIFAFCIMPDHFHLLMCLMPGEDVSKVMQDSGKFTARLINKHYGLSGLFWQHGFHDHRCRNTEEVVDLASYIEHNPVRDGLVASAEEWPYSSACPSLATLLDRDWV